MRFSREYHTASMFYDHFTKEQICGVFTPTHFVAIAVYYALIAVALVFSRKLKKRATEWTVFGIAIAVTVMEIIKIAIRLYKGENGDAWIPLYFSSLFLYAIWLSLFKNKIVKAMGCTFLAFGGTVAGSLFVLYPSTSLALYPIWHPGSLHSLIYHWLMMYVGILTLMKRYRPRAWHFVLYFGFVAVLSLAAALINHFLGTNLMFLSNPFGLSFLQKLVEFSPVLYALVAFVAQGVVLFWVMYGLTIPFYIKQEKRNQRREENG